GTGALDLRGPETGGEVVHADPNRPALPFGDADRRVAQDLADRPLEVAHAGFPGIALDDLAQRLVRDLDLPELQTVRLHLPAQEKAPGDLELLVGGVAGKGDDLHAVAQRSRNRVEHVR